MQQYNLPVSTGLYQLYPGAIRPGTGRQFEGLMCVQCRLAIVNCVLRMGVDGMRGHLVVSLQVAVEPGAFLCSLKTSPWATISHAGPNPKEREFQDPAIFDCKRLRLLLRRLKKTCRS